MGLYEDIIYLRNYSRWIPELGRRELSWPETVDRFLNFIFNETVNHELIPEKVKRKIKEYILAKEVLPSMRLLWSAGVNAKRDNIAAYNCSAMGVKDLDCFGEMMLILLAGAGAGYSVENRFIKKLPIVEYQDDDVSPTTFIIPDSRVGWKQAVDYGIYSWFGGYDVMFDYSKIRPAGSPLITSGGYSSGPKALRECLDFIRKTIFESQGRQLNSLEVSDIMNEIASSVVCGGVRRSSQICLVDPDDELMLSAKHGDLTQEVRARRAMSNISIVYRERPDYETFQKQFMSMLESRSGEPGIFNLAAARKRTPPRRDASKITLSNPCFTGDMRLLTNSGYHRFDEIADTSGDLSCCVIVNEHDDFSFGSVWYSGVKECVKVDFQSIVADSDEPLYSIKCTPNHKFRLAGGDTCEAKDLVGKRVKTFQRAIEFLVVSAVTPIGLQPVYDFNEPLTHWGIVEGVVVSNCGETLLRDKGLCNLSSVIIRDHDTRETVMDKVKTATWLGIIQSTLTYFPNLSEEWSINAEDERLLGVALSALCDNYDLISADNLKSWKTSAINTAAKASKIMNINMPAAITLSKPDGNTSQLVNGASGIHARWSPYYIRRIRIHVYDPLFRLMADQGMKWEYCLYSKDTAVLSFPIKAPEGSKFRNGDTAIEQLNWYRHVTNNWAEQNSSCTVYTRDDEWEETLDYMYEHFDEITGVTFFPYDNSKYDQAPYEEIDEITYMRLIAEMPTIDFSKLPLYENRDTTEGARTLACAGGACEI